MTLTIVIPGILLAVVAAMMMVSTFELLQKKRQADMALFRIVGADSSHLNAMLYLESLIYGGVGGLLGCILTVPLIAVLNNLYSFKHSRMSFGILEILVGLGSSIIFTLICTLVHIRKQKKKSLYSSLSAGNFDTDRRFSYKKLIYAIPVLVFVAILTALPATEKYMAGIMLMLSIVVFIYVISPYVIGWLVSLVSFVLSKRRSGAGDFIIAAKSCQNSYPLRHAGRIMTVLVTIFVTLTFVLSAVNEQLEAYVNFATFDYIGMNVDDKTRDMIENTDGVLATSECMINRNVFFKDGVGTTGVGIVGDYEMCFDDTITPSTLPKGDELALSRGVATMLELEIGDRVECTIADIACTLTLVEVIDTRGDFAFYDAEYVGNSLDMFCVLTDGTDETLERVIAVFDERGIECLDSDEFFAQTYERINPQLAVFRAMFYVMIFMTVVGIFNILGEQRLARMREFEIIKQNGRTDKGIVAMQAIEVTYLLLCAILCSVVFSFVLCYVINVSAMSFGLTIY